MIVCFVFFLRQTEREIDRERVRDSKGIIYFKWKRILPTVSGSISRKKFGMEFHFLTIQKDTFVPIVNVGEKRKTDIHTYIVHTRMRYSCKNLVKETFFF